MKAIYVVYSVCIQIASSNTVIMFELSEFKLNWVNKEKKTKLNSNSGTNSDMYTVVVWIE